jgi:ABC-type branched-subunit amino acid transport system permease subunit
MRKPGAALMVAVVLAAVAAVAVTPVVAPWARVILTIILAKALAVLGILVLLRAGQVSFGHGMFYAGSAYAAAFLARAGSGGSDVALLLVAGVACAIVFGTAVGLFVVRYRSIFFGMLNLAFSMVLYSLLQKSFHLTGGSDGLRVPRPAFFGLTLDRDAFEWAFFYFVLGLAIAVTVAVRRYLDSPLGRALGALKTNETRLEYLGVSARRVLLVAYVLSAVLAGLAGTILAIANGHVTPESGYWVRSGEFVFIAVLGGSGSVAGPFVGTLVYELVRLYASAYAAEIWQAVLGVVLLLVILFAPGGLVGILGRRGHRQEKAEAAP